jgi:hypothetical protein
MNGGVDERMIRRADVRAGKSTESQEAHEPHNGESDYYAGLGR